MRHARLKWRALLTETLPYEVPVIFSNDRLFASQLSEPKDGQVAAELKKIWDLLSSGSAPYRYSIRKDKTGTTELAIIHPLNQLEIAQFYEAYAQSILDCCRKSEYSLRCPISVVSAFTEARMEDGATPKLGIPHIEPEDGEIDVSRITSYFAYTKYNLMYRFYDSAEFLRLEKRFGRLRMLDVTKCFYNIYTHTLTWAVKERSFAKENRHAYSFESRFDELMQHANSNETNGIVVGPEVSRIFAEIIFQDIDKRVLNRLRERVGTHNRAYAIRRYVDDYHIFANTDEDLDRIEGVIKEELFSYKMFSNEKKVVTLSRPFVSDISLARREVGRILASVAPKVGELLKGTDAEELKTIARAVREEMRDIRLTVAKHRVGFNTISGWLFGAFRRNIKQMVAWCNKGLSSDQRESIADSVMSILEVVFYACALDMRVRASYSLCQIISEVQQLQPHVSADQYDRVLHLISEECTDLMRALLAKSRKESSPQESIELYNLMICGSHYVGGDFVRGDVCRDALQSIVDAPTLRYFGFITAKFCMRKDEAHFATQLQKLNATAVSRVKQGGAKGVSTESELFLLLADLLSSPDLSASDKLALLKAVTKGSPSKAVAESLGRCVGFADWDGLKIDHTLARKELLPAYAWS